MTGDSVTKPTESSELEQKLRQLRELFVAQLPARIDGLFSLNQRLAESVENQQSLTELLQATHSLAGAGGTFGYPRLSDQARILEHALARYLRNDKPLDESARQAISAGLEKLKELSLQGPEEEGPHPRPRSASMSPAVAGRTAQQNLLYIVGDDPLFAQELAVRLSRYGYQTECLHSASATSEALNRKIPCAMLIDVALQEGDTTGLDLVAGLVALRTHSVPLFFISERDDCAARLACLRAGGREYFTRPIDIARVVEKLDVLNSESTQASCRVLIVEDVEVLAQHYALVLRSAGHEVTIVNSVHLLFEALSHEKVELILMDLHMPECNGLEAAQMIRQIDDYVGVPIVFLSTESKIGEQLKAMKIGGDEFLHKPIRDDHLIAAVEIRARRFRNLRLLMVHDGLTGLLNHHTLDNELGRELSRAQRDNSEMAFVLLAIDHFKRINDQYGHRTGDKVLKSLARKLGQRLRKSDIIARYGGEQFAVILPSSTEQEVFSLIDDIRLDFSRLEQLHATGSFQVSFSAGIAYSRENKTQEEIVRAADSALYEARRQGRNRVVFAE